MSNPFKVITIAHDEDELQTYVVEARVTADQVRQGNDDGVLCYCMSSETADVIASALNCTANANAFLEQYLGANLGTLALATRAFGGRA